MLKLRRVRVVVENMSTPHHIFICTVIYELIAIADDEAVITPISSLSSRHSPIEEWTNSQRSRPNIDQSQSEGIYHTEKYTRHDGTTAASKDTREIGRVLDVNKEKQDGSPEDCDD